MMGGCAFFGLQNQFTPIIKLGRARIFFNKEESHLGLLEGE